MIIIILCVLGCSVGRFTDVTKNKEKHGPIGPIPAQSSRINYAAAPSEGATLLRIYI